MSLQYPDLAALILRIGFGGYMLFGHGLSKLLKLTSGAEVKFYSFLGLSPTFTLSLVVFAEFLACILIIIGYKTRLAALPLIFTMLIAGFYYHSGDSWFMQQAAEGEGSKEPAFIYLIGFVSIYLLGSGKYSIDDTIDTVL